jgi:hypothetical protein
MKPNKIEHSILSVDGPVFESFKKADFVRNFHEKGIFEDKDTNKLISSMSLKKLRLESVLQCKREWYEIIVGYPESEWFKAKLAKIRMVQK